jgi:hypothetical protein
MTRLASFIFHLRYRYKSANPFTWIYLHGQRYEHLFGSTIYLFHGADLVRALRLFALISAHTIYSEQEFLITMVLLPEGTSLPKSMTQVSEGVEPQPFHQHLLGLLRIASSVRYGRSSP